MSGASRSFSRRSGDVLGRRAPRHGGGARVRAPDGSRAGRPGERSPEGLAVPDRSGLVRGPPVDPAGPRPRGGGRGGPPLLEDLLAGRDRRPPPPRRSRPHRGPRLHAGPGGGLRARSLAARRLSVPVQPAAGFSVTVVGLFGVAMLALGGRAAARARRAGALGALSLLPISISLLLAGHLPTLSYATVVPAIVLS